MRPPLKYGPDRLLNVKVVRNITNGKFIDLGSDHTAYHIDNLFTPPPSLLTSLVRLWAGPTVKVVYVLAPV